ncbi:MAG: bifunctional phosphoribosylaminoimidazolecarboxamide formyltransferase/IMP cyclohydrolase [Chloroflexi bacterium]|nr:bifunctional phosphoribosylaminoimidazolecarboxamide formyltransferase/IMP cyclohydrolase [Chloroflexota bacterium]
MVLKALISVYDKAGVVEFARSLTQSGTKLVSTGGTYKTLTEAGLAVQQVSDLTGFPEILDGRVKTLHPRVHGGILARRESADHIAQLSKHKIEPIDMVVVNLYPFMETILRSGVTLDEALENIDIGGPTMIRAAAKNFKDVVVVVDPKDYSWISEHLKEGNLTLEERKGLAQKAFQHVALYDTTIAQYLRQGDGQFPEEITLGYTKLFTLRYGENPHQRAAFYAQVPSPQGIASARQLHGKELSFNNILDADAAWRAVCDFSESAVAIIKHTNPCGLAVHQNQAEAYRQAYEGDPVSAFGGIVAFNRRLTGEAAEAMRRIFYEIVVAPGYDTEALEILMKKKDLRILEIPQQKQGPQKNLDLRKVGGGILLQSYDDIQEDAATWKAVTHRHPTSQELDELAFAWKVVKHIKSNAIVLVKDRAIVGMGAGQPNRVTSVHLALRSAGDKAKGSVLASDAFFPFADGVELAAQGGITAIAQPGGSIRDPEVIAAADRANIAMVFTGVRHFRH